jgi:hypothetical protein
MQKVDRTDTIHVGVWIRSSGAIRIIGTQSVRRSNYQHDITRRSKRKAKSVDGDGRRYDPSRTPPRSTESKR